MSFIYESNDLLTFVVSTFIIYLVRYIIVGKVLGMYINVDGKVNVHKRGWCGKTNPIR